MSASLYFPLTGAAYVAQLANEVSLSNKQAVCNNCLSSGSAGSTLRRCVGCRLAAYCSTECQKKDWPRHRAFCNLVQAKGKKNAYLSALEQEDCFRQLIDSYRLRVENDHLQRHQDHGLYFSGELERGLVWASGDAYQDFQHYLDITEDEGILPKWWNFETRMECLAIAVDEESADNVLTKADQETILGKYNGDVSARNALSILAELVVGYEGKGSAKDEDWIQEFRQHLEAHPEERDKLVAETARSKE